MSKIWFGLLGVVSMSMLMACGDSSSTNADNSENSTESSSSIGGNSDKPTSSSGTSVEAPANGYDAEASILTDARDRKKYKVVKIGSQVWMAENLNYEYNGNEESWCPNHSLSGCNTYGHLYTWEAANKVCPEGWHLPSQEEFEVLLKLASSDVETDEDDVKTWLGAGLALKSTEGWYTAAGSSNRDPDVGTDGNGLDTYGFAIVPAGQYNPADMNFAGIKHHAAFWTSTEVDDFIAYAPIAYAPIAYNDRSIITGGSNDIDFGLSVRCVLTEE